MNYVNDYIQLRKKYPDYRDRHLIFSIMAESIAKWGTIADLRALAEYREKESEEIENEKNSVASSQIS